MNEVATQQTAADAWGAYAEATAAKNTGDFLAFRKGFLEYGQDKKEIPMPAEFILNMDEFKTGWQRWKNKKPADEKTVRVVTGMAPATRDTLGYEDESEWDDKTKSNGEVEMKDGKAVKQDPWQKLSSVPCVDLEGKQYTFTTGSVGGMQALGKLCAAYGQQVREHPDDHPVVSIDKDSYQSDDYGKVFFPVFEIVRWISKDESYDTTATASATAQVEDNSAQETQQATAESEF